MNASKLDQGMVRLVHLLHCINYCVHSLCLPQVSPSFFLSWSELLSSLTTLEGYTIVLDLSGEDRFDLNFSIPEGTGVELLGNRTLANEAGEDSCTVYVGDDVEVLGRVNMIVS